LKDKSFYNTILVGQLCEILRLATLAGKYQSMIFHLLNQFFLLLFSDSNIRLVTLSLAINLLKILVYNEEEKISYLSDDHLARIEQAHEQATDDLRRHYQVEKYSN
jgi:hypothetical protein